MAQLLIPRSSARLTLRQFCEDDVSLLADLYGRDDVTRYLYWSTRTLDELREMHERRLARPVEEEDDNVLPVAVVLTESGTLIGDFMLRWRRDEHHQGEVGGALLPAHHNRGYATEVYGVLSDIGFGDYGLHRIIGRCDARNEASIRSLERAGFIREAHLIENEFVKGEWTSEVVLARRADQ